MAENNKKNCNCVTFEELHETYMNVLLLLRKNPLELVKSIVLLQDFCGLMLQFNACHNVGDNKFKLKMFINAFFRGLDDASNFSELALGEDFFNNMLKLLEQAFLCLTECLRKPTQLELLSCHYFSHQHPPVFMLKIALLKRMHAVLGREFVNIYGDQWSFYRESHEKLPTHMKLNVTIKVFSYFKQYHDKLVEAGLFSEEVMFDLFDGRDHQLTVYNIQKLLSKNQRIKFGYDCPHGVPCVPLSLACRKPS